MNRLRSVARIVVLLSIAAAASTANAGFHLWQVKEVFTSADGAVQFVEMFDPSPGETFMAGKTLRATSDGVNKDFVFPSNLTKDTAGKSMLIATTGFGSLAGGVTPDFTFSQSSTPFTAPFFNPNAANLSITFFGSGSSMSFTGAQLPKNGIDSINSPTTIAPNSPKNLDSMMGSVDLSTPSPTGDYNGNHKVDGADYVVWRKTFGQTVSPNGSGADGDANGSIGTGDYTFWRSHFGDLAGSGSVSGEAFAAPEPTAVILLFAGLFTLALRRRKCVL